MHKLESCNVVSSKSFYITAYLLPCYGHTHKFRVCVSLNLSQLTSVRTTDTDTSAGKRLMGETRRNNRYEPWSKNDES